MTKDAHIWKEEDLIHVETQKRIAPFSFFKSLFYHPKQFEGTQLQAILQHEKVHARQWHSIDVILSELLKVLLWFNPLIWLYQRTIQQNLEFLADAQAIGHFNKKSYQYLMVNQASGHQIAITNSFYNSLIKKRIVMLNKNQSKRTSALKSLLVIPILAIFLVSFGTEKVYKFHSTSDIAQTKSNAKVEVIINKTTTDDELVTIKNDLANEGVDFSYTVVRNDAREIIDISLDISGRGENGGSFKNSHNSSDSENGIAPLVIFIDLENNLVSIGTKGAYKSKVTKIKKGEGTVWVSSEGNEGVNVWSGLDEIGEHEDIVIIEKDGTQKVILNGKEINRDSLHSEGFNIVVVEDEEDKKATVHFLSEEGSVLEEKVMELKNNSGQNISIHVDTDVDKDYKKEVKIKKHKSKKGKQVMIIKDSDEDTDIEVLGDEGYFFIDTEGKDPLYIIDGKEASKKEVKKLSPKDIMTIDVSKGKAASKKYGKKAKDGVVEIITKKKN